MSMMMPPDAAPGLPTTPGGGDPGVGGNAPPMDMMNQGPVPGDGGMAGLLAALGGGGDQSGGTPADAGGGDQGQGELDSIGHIQAAMQHLMMALAKEPDEQQGHGIVKGMAGLQGILGGNAKKQADLAALGGAAGGNGGPPSGG